ncbi:MAG TPA: glycosyltransferase family 2 protein [Candidatus Angelobacter sp.]|nr:glycosyltransferase family 2 protein [Candidatus Angelobacter sp.]
MRNEAAKYDLAVAYRIYPGMAKAALGLPFSGDKYRLAEACLRSFRNSLGTLRARIWVLLDGCPPAYAELFHKYFADEDLVLLRLPGIGNQGTFLQQIEILSNQEDAQLVYFAEDDYFYLPGQFHLMTNFMKTFPEMQFITPYDHLDCYTLDLHRKPKWLRVHAGHHWRTAASTCLTFLTSKETLQQTAGIFRTYARKNFDCSIWLSLTKQSVLRPLDFCRWVLREPLFAKITLRAWWFGWAQILFGKRHKLWVPVPGIATHLNAEALSPSIDWLARMSEDEPPL